MKNIMKRAFTIFSIAVLILCNSCNEDTIDLLGVGTVTGRVVEAETFDPIENAKISLSPSNNTVFSDENGYFIIKEVEAGDYSVTTSKESYLTNFKPATVTTDLEVNVIFEMEDENALNKAPSTPILVTPEDGSENLELSIKFVWSSSDPEGDTLNYRLELKNDLNNDILIFENISDTTYVVSDLKYGTKYFWQIAANDEINSEVLSQVRAFKTKIYTENRYLFVSKASNNNHIISSASFDDEEETFKNVVKLTSDDQNSWRPRRNPASSLIAFLRTTNNETHLFTMNSDGSNVFQVTSSIPVNGSNLNEIDYSWSSSGDRLMYSYFDKLYVIKKDGSGLELIYQTVDGSLITECDWSNDGSMIALKTNDISGYNVSIYTIDMSGSVIDNVLTDVKGAAGGLDISIDNKLLVYSYDISQFENGDKRQLNSRIYIYNFTTKSSKDISLGKDTGSNDLDPRFSPNEAQIIFVNTSNDGVSIKSIYRMDIGEDNSNNNTRLLLFNNGFMPDWE